MAVKSLLLSTQRQEITRLYVTYVVQRSRSIPKETQIDFFSTGIEVDVKLMQLEEDEERPLQRQIQCSEIWCAHITLRLSFYELSRATCIL